MFNTSLLRASGGSRTLRCVAALLGCLILAAAKSPAAEEDTAQPQPPQSDAPRLVCLKPKYDFGAVESGREIRHSFTLKNTGARPLKIAGIRPDCGCTTAKPASEVIPPGGETTIEAVLSLKGLRGRQQKRIAIHSNDPQNPIFVLSIEGEAVVAVEVEPDRLHLGTITLDSDEIRIIDVVCRTNGPFTVLYAESTLSQFQVDVETVKKGWHYRVRATALPPFVRGAIKGEIMVWTDHPQFKRIEIPVYGRAISGLYTIPDEFILDPAADERQSRLLVLRSADGAGFKVLDVKPPDADMQVNITPMRSGAYRIELRFTQSPKLDGRSLLITTDVKRDAEIYVPFKFVSLAPDPDMETGK